MTACGGDLRDAIDLAAPHNDPGGRSSSPSPVIGTWQADIVVSVDLDVQRWVTTWRFDRDGTCHFQRVTTSIATGIPVTVDRDCTYTVTQSTIEVVYTGTTDTGSLPYAFPDPSTNDTLTLEGVDYSRIA